MSLRDYLLESYGNVYISGIGQNDKIEDVFIDNILDYEYNNVRKSYVISNIKNEKVINKVVQGISKKFKNSSYHDKIEIEIKNTSMTLDDFV